MLFVALIIIGLFVLGDLAGPTKEDFIKHCDVHKWEYINNSMVCSVCKFKAGSWTSEHGQY